MSIDPHDRDDQGASPTPAPEAETAPPPRGGKRSPAKAKQAAGKGGTKAKTGTKTGAKKPRAAAPAEAASRLGHDPLGGLAPTDQSPAPDQPGLAPGDLERLFTAGTTGPSLDWRQVLDHLNLPLAVSSLEDGLIYANPAFLDMLALDELAALADLDWDIDLFAPASGQAGPVRQALLTDDTPVSHFATCTLPDGSRLELLLESRALADPNLPGACALSFCLPQPEPAAADEPEWETEEAPYCHPLDDDFETSLDRALGPDLEAGAEPGQGFSPRRETDPHEAYRAYVLANRVLFHQAELNEVSLGYALGQIMDHLGQGRAAVPAGDLRVSPLGLGRATALMLGRVFWELWGLVLDLGGEAAPVSVSIDGGTGRHQEVTLTLATPQEKAFKKLKVRGDKPGGLGPLADYVAGLGGAFFKIKGQGTAVRVVLPR